LTNKSFFNSFTAYLIEIMGL